MKICILRTLCLTGMALTALNLSAQTPTTSATDTTTTTTIVTETPTTVVTAPPTVITPPENIRANQLLRNPEELFRRLDANADGILSMPEFMRIAALADGAAVGRPNPAVTPGMAPGTPIPPAETRASPAPPTGTAPGTNLGN